MKTMALIMMAAGMAAAAPAPSLISVRLTMQSDVFVSGEGYTGYVTVDNSSADDIDVGNPDSPDRLFVELFRASDKKQYDRISNRPFVVSFSLKSGEGLRLETILADHYAFPDTTRYFARAVLVHAGTRYESSLKSFDIVPGLRDGGAVQMFKEKPGLKREYELVHWVRNQVEHLFLKAKDSGAENRIWRTSDLGPILRVTPPKISVLTSGEVIVLHRATQSAFIRSEFWSLPEAFEFHEHEVMADPDTVGAERVKEIYKESGGTEPVKKAWWKFW